MAEVEQRRALGRAIRFARSRRDRMLQRELADRARVARSHLSRIETGEVSPSLVVLERIAHALGLTADELVREARQERERRV